jgi:hypothetical protein
LTGRGNNQYAEKKKEHAMKKSKSRTMEVRITCGKKSCKVSSDYIVVEQGKSVKFRNLTKDVVHIQVSDDALFKFPIFTIAKGKNESQVVRNVRRGIYPYAVFCVENGKFCTGSSMPIIIVPRDKDTD